MGHSRQQDSINITLYLAIQAGSSQRNMGFGAGYVSGITQAALKQSIRIEKMIYISKDLLRVLLRAIIHETNGCRYLKETT